MIKNHVATLLNQNLPFSPTGCQQKLISGLSEFIVSDEQDTIFLMKGFAGTGKTSMINVLAHTLASLKIRTILLAPTGRAAKVMAGYSNMPAFTIHKKIYRQQTSADGTGRFVLDKNLYKNTWFIVDEASMVSNSSNEHAIFGSGNLLDDLLEYVYSGTNCRLVLSGDTAQLPPVGLSISPALEASRLIQHGFDVKEYILTEVVRQSAGSGILSYATHIRQEIAKDSLSGFISFESLDFP